MKRVPSHAIDAPIRGAGSPATPASSCVHVNPSKPHVSLKTVPGSPLKSDAPPNSNTWSPTAPPPAIAAPSRAPGGHDAQSWVHAPSAKTHVSGSAAGVSNEAVPPYITTPVGAVAIPENPRAPGAHTAHTCDHEVPSQSHDAALAFGIALVADAPP